MYDCATTDLLDLADHEHMPTADQLILDKTAPTDGGSAAPPLAAGPRERDQLDVLTASADADAVRRNEFLVLTGISVASLLAPPLVHEWQERHDPAPPELTDQVLAQARAQTEGLRWLDRKHGASGLLAYTTRHAGYLAGLWRLTESSSPLRPDLAEAAAGACHLVAYQAYDQGDRARAAEWYRSAAELAARGGAKDLYAFAVCGVAFIHARNGNGELALSVLRQLMPLRLSAAADCYMAVYEAHAHASILQHDPALRALDRAAGCATRASSEAPSPWLGIPNNAFAERQRATILAKFGSPEAFTVLARLSQQTPEVFQRYRITLLTDQAMAHARIGNVDQPADLLSTALYRSEHIRSARRNGCTSWRSARSSPDGSASSVRALDEVLRATTPTALTAALPES